VKASELEALTESLLLEGVPTEIVARVLDLDVTLIRATRDSVRVREYGTDDLAEYLRQLEWKAVMVCRRSLDGEKITPDALKTATALIGKTAAVNARRTPEKDSEQREQLLRALSSMTEDDGTVAEQDTSEFEDWVPVVSG
jgi:hypothetical protein